jgi:hypothetical protein
MVSLLWFSVVLKRFVSWNRSDGVIPAWIYDEEVEESSSQVLVTLVLDHAKSVRQYVGEHNS